MSEANDAIRARGSADQPEKETAQESLEPKSNAEIWQRMADRRQRQIPYAISHSPSSIQHIRPCSKPMPSGRTSSGCARRRRSA